MTKAKKRKVIKIKRRDLVNARVYQEILRQGLMALLRGASKKARR